MALENFTFEIEAELSAFLDQIAKARNSIEQLVSTVQEGASRLQQSFERIDLDQSFDTTKIKEFGNTLDNTSSQVSNFSGNSEKASKAIDHVSTSSNELGTSSQSLITFTESFKVLIKTVLGITGTFVTLKLFRNFLNDVVTALDAGGNVRSISGFTRGVFQLVGGLARATAQLGLFPPALSKVFVSLDLTAQGINRAVGGFSLLASQSPQVVNFARSFVSTFDQVEQSISNVGKTIPLVNKVISAFSTTASSSSTSFDSLTQAIAQLSGRGIRSLLDSGGNLNKLFTELFDDTTSLGKSFAVFTSRITQAGVQVGILDNVAKLLNKSSGSVLVNLIKLTTSTGPLRAKINFLKSAFTDLSATLQGLTKNSVFFKTIIEELSPEINQFGSSIKKNLINTLRNIAKDIIELIVPALTSFRARLVGLNGAAGEFFQSFFTLFDSVTKKVLDFAKSSSVLRQFALDIEASFTGVKRSVDKTTAAFTKSNKATKATNTVIIDLKNTSVELQTAFRELFGTTSLGLSQTSKSVSNFAQSSKQATSITGKFVERVGALRDRFFGTRQATSETSSVLGTLNSRISNSVSSIKQLASENLALRSGLAGSAKALRGFRGELASITEDFLGKLNILLGDNAKILEKVNLSAKTTQKAAGGLAADIQKTFIASGKLKTGLAGAIPGLDKTAIKLGETAAAAGLAGAAMSSAGVSGGTLASTISIGLLGAILAINIVLGTFVGLINKVSSILINFSVSSAKLASQLKLLDAQLRLTLESVSENTGQADAAFDKFKETIEEVAEEFGAARLDVEKAALSFIQLQPELGFTADQIQKLTRTSIALGKSIGDQPRVLNAITQAFRGQSRPLRNLIGLNLDIATVEKSLAEVRARGGDEAEKLKDLTDEQADSQVKLNLILKRAGPIVETIAENQNTLNIASQQLKNSIVDLQLEFGKVSDPILTRLAQTLTVIIRSFELLPTPITFVIEKLVALVTIGSTVLSLFLRFAIPITIVTQGINLLNVALSGNIPLFKNFSRTISAAFSQVAGVGIQINKASDITKAFGIIFLQTWRNAENAASSLLKRILLFNFSGGKLVGIITSIGGGLVTFAKDLVRIGQIFAINTLRLNNYRVALRLARRTQTGFITSLAIPSKFFAQTALLSLVAAAIVKINEKYNILEQLSGPVGEAIDRITEKFGGLSVVGSIIGNILSFITDSIFGAFQVAALGVTSGLIAFTFVLKQATALAHLLGFGVGDVDKQMQAFDDTLGGLSFTAFKLSDDVSETGTQLLKTGTNIAKTTGLAGTLQEQFEKLGKVGGDAATRLQDKIRVFAEQAEKAFQDTAANITKTIDDVIAEGDRLSAIRLEDIEREEKNALEKERKIRETTLNRIREVVSLEEEKTDTLLNLIEEEENAQILALENTTQKSKESANKRIQDTANIKSGTIKSEIDIQNNLKDSLQKQLANVQSFIQSRKQIVKNATEAIKDLERSVGNEIADIGIGILEGAEKNSKIEGEIYSEKRKARKLIAEGEFEDAEDILGRIRQLNSQLSGDTLEDRKNIARIQESNLNDFLKLSKKVQEGIRGQGSESIEQAQKVAQTLEQRILEVQSNVQTLIRELNQERVNIAVDFDVDDTAVQQKITQLQKQVVHIPAIIDVKNANIPGGSIHPLQEAGGVIQKVLTPGTINAFVGVTGIDSGLKSIEGFVQSVENIIETRIPNSVQLALTKFNVDKSAATSLGKALADLANSGYSGALELAQITEAQLTDASDRFTRGLQGAIEHAVEVAGKAIGRKSIGQVLVEDAKLAQRAFDESLTNIEQRVLQFLDRAQKLQAIRDNLRENPIVTSIAVGYVDQNGNPLTLNEVRLLEFKDANKKPSPIVIEVEANEIDIEGGSVHKLSDAAEVLGEVITPDTIETNLDLMTKKAMQTFGKFSEEIKTVTTNIQTTIADSEVNSVIKRIQGIFNRKDIKVNLTAEQIDIKGASPHTFNEVPRVLAQLFKPDPLDLSGIVNQLNVQQGLQVPRVAPVLSPTAAALQQTRAAGQTLPSQFVRVDINVNDKKFTVDAANKDSANSLVELAKEMELINKTQGTYVSPFRQ